MISSFGKVLIKSLFILCIYSVRLFTQNANEKRPFSMNSFDIFLPPSSIEAVEKIYGKGREGKSPNEGIIQRAYTVSKSNFWVQLKEGRIIDSYVTLPTHLSHDAFHKSLIDRYGKQDRYFKKNRNAVYQWNDKNGRKITYSGQCTLTCFPHYLAVTLNKKPVGIPTFKSLLQFFSEEEF